MKELKIKPTSMKSPEKIREFFIFVLFSHSESYIRDFSKSETAGV